MIDSTKNHYSLAPFQVFTNNPENKIIFSNVYNNGFHSLQQMEAQNNTNAVLRISLETSLKDQVVFQLTNENLEESHLTKSLATNTSTTPLNFSSFNQVFNYINHIEQLILQPHQKLEFVIGFLPVANSPDKDESIAVFTTVTGIVTFRSDSYTLDMPLEAKTCQSILTIDDFDQDLIFDDCVVGNTYMRDITIRNVSAIDLYWKLNTSDISYTDSDNKSDCLQFIDIDTYNELLYEVNSISPLSYYTFRVLFTPKEAGKFNYDLQLENVNDVNNIIQTKIHATIRNFMHRETLFIATGNMLDFGDCISGCWSKQLIVLKNISESPIELHLTTKGAEMAFNIETKPDEEKHDSSRLLNENRLDYFGSISSSTDARPTSPATSSKTYSSSSHDSSSTSGPSTGKITKLLSVYRQINSCALYRYGH